MTLQRLLDGPGDDFESALLRSAQADLPTDADVRRGIAALGVAAGGALASSAAASSLVTAAGAAGSAGPAHGAVGAAAVAKWLGIGFLAGTVASGGGIWIAPAVDAAVAKHHEPTRAPPAATIAAVPAPAPAGPAELPESPATSTPEETPEPRARAFAPVAPRPSANAQARSAGVAPGLPESLPATPATSLLAAELATLSRARLAQSGREPARALLELDEYDRLPRPHVLEGEASLLRMEALIQVGRQAEASRLARDYLRLHPASPHRSRLHQIASEE